MSDRAAKRDLFPLSELAYNLIMRIKAISTRTMSLVFVALFVANSAFAEVDSRGLQLLKQKYQTQHKEFASQMLRWAEFCEQKSFFTDAEKIRWRANADLENEIDYDDLPNGLLPDLPKQMGPIEAQWRTAVRKLEQDYATNLFRLAREAIGQNLASFAFQRVRELVYYDPDHKHGRRMLGFILSEGEWTTPFELSKTRANFVDHPDFGWMRKGNKTRYENGERLFNGRWMSREKEEQQRKVFRNGWEIESEHFFIKTNHSLEQGVKIRRDLEIFHKFFMREYAALFDNPQKMKKLFEGGVNPRSRSTKAHQIYYFANREEFVDVLKLKKQQVLEATGFYLPPERTSFFYYDDNPEQAEANQETMYHEVTHQLLGESTRTRFDVAEFNNFWVVEGFPCYLESFDIEYIKPSQGDVAERPKYKVHVGDPTHPRIYWARQNALVEDLYFSMPKFMALSMRDFQFPPNPSLRHAYYSQATGFVHFFLHYDDGIYRDAFIEFLSQVYSDSKRVRENPDTLEELTGVPFATLERQYIDYLRKLPTR